MICVGDVGLGARLWIVSARLGLARGVVCVDEGWAWRAAVDCIGEVGFCARL